MQLRSRPTASIHLTAHTGPRRATSPAAVRGCLKRLCPSSLYRKCGKQLLDARTAALLAVHRVRIQRNNFFEFSSAFQTAVFVNWHDFTPYGPNQGTCLTCDLNLVRRKSVRLLHPAILQPYRPDLRSAKVAESCIAFATSESAYRI